MLIEIVPWHEVKNIPNIRNRMPDICVNMGEGQDYDKILTKMERAGYHIDGYILFLRSPEGDDIRALLACSVIDGLDGKQVMYEQVVWVDAEHPSLSALVALFREYENLAHELCVNKIMAGCAMGVPYFDKYIRFLQRRGFYGVNATYQKEI